MINDFDLLRKEKRLLTQHNINIYVRSIQDVFHF